MVALAVSRLGDRPCTSLKIDHHSRSLAYEVNFMLLDQKNPFILFFVDEIIHVIWITKENKSSIRMFSTCVVVIQMFLCDQKVLVGFENRNFDTFQVKFEYLEGGYAWSDTESASGSGGG